MPKLKSGLQYCTLYYKKSGKKLFDFLAGFLGLILLCPVFLIITILIFLDSGRPIFFCQKRIGKYGKIFTIFKFRTMVKNAQKLQKKYLHLNEASGPVFKIRHDPRFTAFGKKLARSGLDELPQLLNVLLGQMSLVGPRPLPINEEKRIKYFTINHQRPRTKYGKFQKLRKSIRPGITSSWVVSGTHNLNFNQWMKLDNTYIKNISFWQDLRIILKTISIIIK